MLNGGVSLPGARRPLPRQQALVFPCEDRTVHPLAEGLRGWGRPTAPPMEELAKIVREVPRRQDQDVFLTQASERRPKCLVMARAQSRL